MKQIIKMIQLLKKINLIISKIKNINIFLIKIPNLFYLNYVQEFFLIILLSSILQKLLIIFDFDNDFKYIYTKYFLKIIFKKYNFIINKLIKINKILLS